MTSEASRGRLRIAARPSLSQAERRLSKLAARSIPTVHLTNFFDWHLAYDEAGLQPIGPSVNNTQFNLYIETKTANDKTPKKRDSGGAFLTLPSEHTSPGQPVSQDHNRRERRNSFQVCETEALEEANTIAADLGTKKNYCGVCPAEPWRLHIHQLIDHPQSSFSARVIGIVLTIIIIISIVAFCLETVSELQPYADGFEAIEWFVNLVFSFEYCLRVFASRRPYAAIFQAWNIMDLLAILPFYIKISIGEG